MERKELIERLHNAKKDVLSLGECWNLMDDAADMLEADGKDRNSNPAPATSDEWLANCPQSVRDLANRIKAQIAVQQEPKYWEYKGDLYNRKVHKDSTPLYASQVTQRPRLTNEELDNLVFDCGISATARDIARAIEAKVRGDV